MLIFFFSTIYFAYIYFIQCKLYSKKKRFILIRDPQITEAVLSCISYLMVKMILYEYLRFQEIKCKVGDNRQRSVIMRYYIISIF
jgi:hypothetical protein